MRLLRRTIIAGSAAVVAGCAPPVQIDRMNIHTVAVSCDVSRGSADAGQVEGDADIAAQAGATAAAWAGQLHSVIQCRDVRVEASTDTEATDELLCLGAPVPPDNAKPAGREWRCSDTGWTFR